MGLKEIIIDTFDPMRMANKFIIFYALGTFFYGIAFGILISFYAKGYFDTHSKTLVTVVIIFLIGFIIVGPSYSKIMRTYEIKVKK
jgi:hypothetical protein